MLICQECGKPYYRKPSMRMKSKYCSRVCHNKVAGKAKKPAISARMLGVNNHKWKGDNVGYSALHAWVSRRLGRIKECSHCGNENNIQWASVSHKAKRDLNDYIPLCMKCHAAYDDYVNKSWQTRKMTYENL